MVLCSLRFCACSVCSVECILFLFFVCFSLTHPIFLFHFNFRAAIQALAAYLDAFQKIADAATNSRGKLCVTSVRARALPKHHVLGSRTNGRTLRAVVFGLRDEK